MAKEIGDLQVTPEVTMSSGVELRRHSTGKASARNIEEKVVPHYLRTSTGSCHDICKYGRKEASEVKDRSSIPKRAERKHLCRSSEEILGGIMISVAKPKASIDFSKPRASIDPKPTKVSVIKHRQSVDSQPSSSDAFDTIEPELPTKSSDRQIQIGKEVQISRNKTSLVKVNPSLLTKFHVLSVPKTRRQESSSTFKVETSLKSTSKKEETPLKSTCERFKTHSKSASKKMVTSSKKETEFSEKHVISLNPNSATMQTNASVNSSNDFGGRRSSEINTEMREASLKIDSPLRVSLSSSKPSVKRIASIDTRKHKSLKIVSHLKSQPKPTKEEPKKQKDGAEEKTLYVIKTENQSQALQSDQNASQDIESSLSHSLSPHKFTSSSISQSSSQEDTEESEYATTEFEEDSSSENYESECMENGKKTLEAAKNGKPCFEDKECRVLKLKIIRRKMGETQIEKRGSPRWLKFRKGKVWWNSGAETGSEKVVLRHHQDVKGKKDGQVLFNNMIEETATKLVETKKSKVLALVGAFETVISLQEQKPFDKNVVS